MSSRFVRASKFRHVFCEPEKPENQFTGLDLSVTPGDHYYVQANSKYVSVPVRGGGGPILVLRHDQTGKIPRDAPTLCGHTGAVYDTKWNPFNDGMLYSTSDDGTVGIWQIPEEGLTQKQEAVAFMKGHGKPTTLVACNPVANNVVASASKDHTVKVWDAEKTEDKVTCSDFTGLIQDLVWDYTGKQLGTTCKDKTARIFDARQASVVHSWKAHEGAKSSKMQFLGERNQVLTSGFTKQSKREMKGWDLRNLSEPFFHTELDQSAGVLMPFYDDDTRLLYLAGKGDGNIRVFELVDDSPYVHLTAEHRTSVPCKGMAMVPKRGCNILKCEIARFFKLTSDSIEPLGFIVPRKSEGFQEDIFPDTYAGVPTVEANDWFNGKDGSIKKVSLDPAKNETVAKQAKFNLNPSKKDAASPQKNNTSQQKGGGDDKRTKELEDELAQARDRIKQLELENASLKAELANKT